MGDDEAKELDQQLWDQQMDSDAASGKLDFLREEANVEEGGCLKDWPG
jgi:hypothetical protein